MTKEIEFLREKVKKLESGIIAFLEGNYPHPRIYRPNKCPHDTNYWEECTSCDCEHFEKLLK